MLSGDKQKSITEQLSVVKSLSDTQSELTGTLSTVSGSSTKDIEILFDDTSFGARNN